MQLISRTFDVILQMKRKNFLWKSMSHIVECTTYKDFKTLLTKFMF